MSTEKRIVTCWCGFPGDNHEHRNRSFDYDPAEFWKAQNSPEALTAFKREEESEDENETY